MALNKQRILSELGSVVNQLQSAECGCMGKLFSDPGQGSSMGYGGCQAGGCCHGHGSPYSGEPYSAMNNQCNMNRHCMGQCNPPKLYADTYSYLNKNLMQPVMNEVYNDLKSITPENTIMNNPNMASKMGISPTNQAGLGNMGAMSAGKPNQAGDMSGMSSPGYNVAMGNANATQPSGQYMGQSQAADPTGGMGTHILNMMMGDKSSKPGNTPAQNIQFNESAINAPQSPNGQVGISPLNPGSHGANGTMPNTSYGQDNTSAYAQKPTTGYMAQPNAYVGSAVNNMPPNNYSHNNSGMPRNVQSAQPMTTNSTYGQHTLGMKTFSEMFPGVMKGDLGFDPMAVAIQMNPANQQKVAMNTMQQLMNGNRANVGFAQAQGNQQVMPTQPNQPVQYQQTLQQQQPMQQQPVQQRQQPIQQQPMQQQAMQQQPMQQQATQQQATQQQAMQQQPMQQQPMQQQPMQQQPMQQQPMQQQSMQQQPMQQQPMQQQPMQQHLIQQQPMHQQPIQQQQPTQQKQLMQPQQQLQNVVDPNMRAPTHQVPHQQVYTVGTGSAVQYQQAPSNVNYQYQQQPQQYQTQQLVQQIIDPNTGAVTNAPNLSGEDSLDDKRMIMEPIFPADALKNQSVTYSHHIKHPKNNYYNTLGQPVHMLDAKVYHSPEPPLPQTLSPQPIPAKQRINPQMFSNVKNTVSKTSIMAQDRLGKVTSKSQLQHLYNQYKGSQSFTQQNINAPIQHPTHSEGRIDSKNASPSHLVPVERVGGDTIANNINTNNPMMNKMEQFAVPMGDVAAVVNKPQGDGAVLKQPPLRKGRNGLQDMVYTSGPTSAAWTFHGHSHMPYSTAYRFRSKVR